MTLVTRDPELAEIHDDLSEKRDFKSLYNTIRKIDLPRCGTMA